ncbi:MAG: DUF5110 domain-containing protein [Phycisphaerae bacterium]|nr:DUF5110 domain-containing protein [Phycisphaerae bacterium]
MKQQEVTVLTPGLVRIRFGATAGTNDSVNPLIQSPPPCREVRKKKTAGYLELTTDRWRLHAAATATNPLEGISLELDGVIHTDLRKPDTRNLSGVFRGLDTCDGWTFLGNDDPGQVVHTQELPPGLLSRRGWSLAKATATDLTTDLTVKSNEYYLFIYGRDYLQAIRDLYTLTGRPPLLPRWTLGTWYSRFQPLEPKHYRAAAKGFRSRGMGLDVVVGDMSWHGENWFSLEYNTKRFPDMPGFLQWAKDNHLHVVFNHHPGGLETRDPRFPEFMKQCGFDMKKAMREVAGSSASELTKAYHFDYENPKYFEIYWNLFLKQLFEDGVEMHWIDGDVSIPILKLYYEYSQRHNPNRRSAILSRQKEASLLNHRFPIAFSGDTHVTWASLETNVGLTLAGASEGVMWSHDIGGHYKGIDDEELFCRWLQSGVFSNFLRLHGSGGWNWVDTLKLERRPWKRGKTADAVARRYIPLRYALLPYIETALRVQYDEGLPLTCPLYLRHPEEELAYRLRESEYYFGPDMIVAPIVTKGVDGMADREAWLPTGQWQEYFSGKFVEGDKGFRAEPSILDMPIYLRAGAVVPLATPGEYTGAPADRLRVVPIDKPGSYTSRLYEDDGESMDYTQNRFRWTEFQYKRTKQEHQLTLQPAKGDFDGAAPARAWEIEVWGGAKPTRIRHNGKSLCPKAWRYDRKIGKLTIQLPLTCVYKRQTVFFSAENLRHDDR